jgi:hypothetical protein
LNGVWVRTVGSIKSANREDTSQKTLFILP